MVIKKEKRGGWGSMIGMIKGREVRSVRWVVVKVWRGRGLEVREIRVEMGGKMEERGGMWLGGGGGVREGLEVEKVGYEGVEEMRVKGGWEGVDEEWIEMGDGRGWGKIYDGGVFEKGD